MSGLMSRRRETLALIVSLVVLVASLTALAVYVFAPENIQWFTDMGPGPSIAIFLTLIAARIALTVDWRPKTEPKPTTDDTETREP